MTGRDGVTHCCCFDRLCALSGRGCCCVPHAARVQPLAGRRCRQRIQTDHNPPCQPPLPAKQAGAAPKKHHKYKAGVAFRQTVSIYGAQIGTHRKEAEAAAVAQEGGWEGGLGGSSSRSLGSLPPLQVGPASGDGTRAKAGV